MKFALALFFAIGISTLHAQPTGSLHGAVTDPSNALVPNAAIAVTCGAGTPKGLKTDSQGQFAVTGLAAGNCTVHASAPGFADWEGQSVTVRANETAQLDITLSVRAQNEEVTVASATAAAVDTDPSNNASALVLSQAEMDALPDDPDDLTADLQALAGPAAGPGGGQFYIDGFTGGKLPPKNSIREIRVNQNPFAAQFDKPGQGRVEVFTKPGFDQYHGDAFFQFNDAALNSRNPFVAVKPPYRRKQWGGEIGGSLGHKTSFYADYEQRLLNENATVNAVVLDANDNPLRLVQAVSTPNSGLETDGKLDRQLTTNHTLTLRGEYDRYTNSNAGVGGVSLPGRGYRSTNTESLIQGVETGVLNLNTVNETRFRFRQERNTQQGGPAQPVIAVLDAFTDGGSSVGQSFDRQNRYELQNFTSYVKGAHSVRWGGLLRGVTFTSQAMQNYAGTFTFTSLGSYRLTLEGMQAHLTAAQIRAGGGGASQFTLAAGDPLASVTQFDYGVFAQDDWRIRPNLTLSGGLRYEAQTHVHGEGDPAPRIAIAWAPGAGSSGSSKNVIRAGAGIFYDRLGENLTLDAERQNGIRQQQFLILNPDFFPAVPLPGTLAPGAQPETIRETDAHWRAPRLIQAGIGYERQLPRHITVSANYLHSAGTHQLRSRSINAPLSGTGARPYGGVNAIYLYETSGVFRQDQLFTTISARVNARLTFNGSYVYGRARSNTDGATTFPADPYSLAGEYGRAGFDIRHRFQFSGSWTTRWQLRFSPFVTLNSGRPFNITTGQDTNGDGLYTERPAFATPGTPGAVSTIYGLLDPAPRAGETIIPRNLGNGPDLIAVNMRLSKIFNLNEPKGSKGDPRQIAISLNARNLLNHPNLTLPSGNLASPLFAVPTGLVNGNGSSGARRLDVAIRFSF